MSRTCLLTILILMCTPLVGWTRVDMKEKNDDPIVREFLDWHEKRDILPEKLLQTIRQKHEQSARNKGYDFTVGDALRLSYPQFKKALVKLNNEQSQDAIDLLKKMEEKQDPYLRTNARYQQARALMQSNRYEKAEPILQDIVENHSSRVGGKGQPLYELAVCQKHLLHNKKALQTLQRLAQNQSHISPWIKKRARDLAQNLMRSPEGSLRHIEQLMEYSKRRIQLNKLDKTTMQKQNETTKQSQKHSTQLAQKQIVKSLNTIIEKIEKQQKSQSGGGGGGGQGSMPGAGMGAPGGKSPSGGPASKSAISGGGSKTGPLDRVMRGNKSESWGNLPPKEREKALNRLQSQFPQRYRELIEQYYKSIQKEEE